jgi:type I restriction enzyme, S subunit
MIALIPENISNAYVSQHIALIRLEEECNARYIAWYLSSCEGGLKQFRQLQRGMTKAGLGLDDIKSICIPIPPMIEQHEIVTQIERIFSIVHNTERTVEQGLRQGKILHQNILRFAFEGRLVPQDPTDEPAEILLEKIKREKELIRRTNKTKSSISKTRYIGDSMQMRLS